MYVWFPSPSMFLIRTSWYENAPYWQEPMRNPSAAPPPLTHQTSSFWRDWAHVYEFTRATAPTTYLRDWFNITDIQSQTVWRPAYTSNIIALRITKFISVNAINSWRHFHVVLIIIIQEVYACVLVNTRNIYSIDVWNWIDPMGKKGQVDVWG